VNGRITCKRLFNADAPLTPNRLADVVPAAGCLVLLASLQVNGRIIRKRLHVRIEHVQPSQQTC
jgi:hypothetical protein